MHRNVSIFDDDYVAPPDPLRHAAATVCGKLAQACRNEQTEFALAEALASIATRCGHTTNLKLTAGARDEILRQLNIAKAVLPACLRDYPRAHLIRGLEAAELQTIVWAELPHQRAARPPHTILDADGYARILQNDMSTRSLLEAISDRAYDRRSDEIEAMVGIRTRRPIRDPDGIFG
ncbi:hypothetical protein [Methylobacterium sp. WL9]|uniref:hypothetical protein n=1 Tax=Methylobacterium sp. WL9 TaxID=2603898 RepID=UPI0011CC5A98|nr:hypothetical protein [Methylobacterium sp. WL9]TXN21279.1 hypothetical protein FV217_14885 [Methylobacterium sp. WL9]